MNKQTLDRVGGM